MNAQEIYKSRLMGVDDAVKLLKSGDRLILGHAVGEPTTFTRRMAELAEELKFENIEVNHLVYLGGGEYLAPGMEKHFRNNSEFVGAPVRKAIAECRADFTPCFFHEFPKMIREGYITPDVFAAQCTPPDKFGYVNLGVSCDYALAAIEKAKTVILEVNDQMPTTFGSTFVHVSEVDAFFESSHPLPEIQPPKIGELEMKIGKYIADLIPDGACIQLGIGALPDAILSFLGDKKDLGVHTEMISDGTIPLIESGVINGKRKQTFQGKIVSAFFMGTKKFYDYIDHNPAIQMMPVDYTNDPDIIAQNDNVISVNSCVQVDLTGQVCSEAIGERQISGIGGQLDFVRGASRSKGGKAILALSSTTKDGKTSKIVPFLDHGAPVTTDRCDVNYIVTEYGVAELKGKTLRERARRLINIAHPDFRPDLIKEWERRFGMEWEA
ncbi:acetyl-CoA hydrolase/transferase family protein [Intestinibacillus massiliensis]|uniref:acetyl-CoA hydrolase/transferase family protein n=1 Tax=Intestinibacillus massiliensis TaxID=1871029 RepID=UPI000B36213C|nr:acetyl-CoA hydrolase/transferase C-terminal domain-containing protein [Intestinibacillus massiliensis]